MKKGFRKQDSHLTAPSARTSSKSRSSLHKVLVSPRKWQITLDSVADAICLLDLEDRILDCNKAMMNLLGRAPSETLGNTCWALMHGTSGPIDDCPVVRMRKSLRRESLELSIGDQWFDISADPIVDEAGRLIGAVHILSDITKRKEAEQELQKLASVVRYSSELINLSTLDGRMIFLNDAGSRALGVGPEEVQQTHILQVIPDHLQEKAQTEILPTLMKQGTWEGDLQARNLKTGELTDVHAMTFTISDPVTGAPLFLANVSRDISDRKRAEQRLQESQQQLSDIIDFLPDATLVVDRAGNLIAWNRAMEEMTGVLKKDILGKSSHVCAVALHGQPKSLLVQLVLDGGAELETPWDRLEQKGKTLYAETYMPAIYGGRGGYVWATASPLMDRHGLMIGAIESIRDITHRREMESTLRESEKELETKSRDLEEINTALKVLLKHREEDQKEFESSVLANMKELVFPYLEKLHNSPLKEIQKTYVRILQTHLEEIGAPFLKKLSSKFTDLSPTERQIASLIKDGKRNREISEIMGVSMNTVLTHRYHLRTKLGLKNKDINLVSYLNSANSC